MSEQNGTDLYNDDDAVGDKRTPDVQDIASSENDSSSLNSTEGDSINNTKTINTFTPNTSDVFTPNPLRSERSSTLASPPSDSGSRSVEFPSLPRNGDLDISPHSDHSDGSMATDDAPALRGVDSDVTESAPHSSSQRVALR